MNEPVGTPEPGTVLRLLRELDYMEPGEFVLLHFERASAIMYPLESPDDLLEIGLAGDDDASPYLRVTSVKNLAWFEDTGQSLPVEAWQESLRPASSSLGRSNP